MKIKYFEDHGIDMNNLDSYIYQPYSIHQDKLNYPVFVAGIGRKFPQQHVIFEHTGNPFVNFCIDGSGELHLNNKTYQVKPGSCMVIAKGTPVEYYQTGNKYTTYWIAFTGNSIDNLFLYKDVFFELPDINELIEEWYNICELPKNPDWIIESSTFAYRFILKLNRQMKSVFEKDLTPSANKLRSITEYFTHAISNPYSLDELSKALQLSPAYICRLFKKEYNMTPNGFFELQKITYAKKLLENSEYSINEISSMCGYNDTNYFSSVFKKHTELSPTQYRKKHLNPNSML